MNSDIIESYLLKIKHTKPLILNLTNMVTMDFVANTQLAIGASPIMTNCDDELEELIIACNGINMNIGTLDHTFIERCDIASRLAKKYHKPIILDPVGAGATRMRTTVAKQLAEHATIIKGNASEVMSLTDEKTISKGVDAMHTADDAKNSARQLAMQHHQIIFVSGATDYITDGKEEASIADGTSLMQLVTGMGCALTGIIAAFNAVSSNPFEACYAAGYFYANAGASSARHAKEPSTFRTRFIDALYHPEMNKRHAE